MIKGFSITQVLQASGVTLTPTNVWNNAGTTFTGVLLNVIDTASAAASLLLDLQIGGVSKFRVGKNAVSEQGGAVFGALTGGGTTINYFTGGFRTAASSEVAWTSGNANAGVDLALYRDAANTLAQRNGANAQTSRIYGTYTDASNYRRVAIAMTTGGVASIAPEGAGTGASGNVLHISGLPTANPGPGILWNNGGTVEVGT